MRTISIVVVLLLVLTGCNIGRLSPVEYIRFVANEENGLRQRYESKNCEYIVQYKPSEYIIANELKSEEIDESIMNRLQKELSGLQYFSLSIVPKNAATGTELFSKTPDGQTNEKHDYWAYGLQQDIYLIEGTDTLYPVLFHYEDLYGVRTSADWSIAFEKEEQSSLTNDKILVIEDRVSGQAPIKIKVTKEAINTIPFIVTE